MRFIKGILQELIVIAFSVSESFLSMTRLFLLKSGSTSVAEQEEEQWPAGAAEGVVKAGVLDLRFIGSSRQVLGLSRGGAD